MKGTRVDADIVTRISIVSLQPSGYRKSVVEQDVEVTWYGQSHTEIDVAIELIAVECLHIISTNKVRRHTAGIYSIPLVRYAINKS